MNNYKNKKKEIREPIKCSLDQPYTLETENGRNYHLTGLSAYGGSSIIYTAYFEDSSNYKHNVLVKELFPSTNDIFHCINRDGKGISIRFEDGTLLSENKKWAAKSKREYEALRAVSQEDNGLRNMNTFEPIDYFKAEGNIYTVIETADGEVLQNIVRDRRKSADFVWNCKVMRCLIKREKDLVNRKGYMHLDISPDNIFVLNDNHDINCFLIDYNSAKKIDAIQEATLCESTRKEGYSAPELLRCHKNVQYMNDEALRDILSVHLDIYSLTAVFYSMFLGQAPGEEVSEKTIDENNRVSNRGIAEINDFIFKGLQENPKKRFHENQCQALDMMEEKIEEIINLLEEPYVKLSDIILDNVNNYIPRWSDDPKEEYQIVIEKLQENRFLFISGISGQGKSEFSKAFAKYVKNNNLFNHVCFVTFNQSLKETIASIPFEEFDETKVDLDSRFHEKKRLLGKLDHTNLLIIDNFNQELGVDSAIFDRGNYRIIFTTQIEDNSFGASFPLEKMSDSRAIRLFGKYRGKVVSNKEKEAIRQIIMAVGGHTMAISVIASMIREKVITINEMADEFQKMGLPTQLTNQIEYYKDRERHEETLSDIFKKLFNISAFNDDEKELLQFISLLPDRGIPLKLFKILAKIEKNSKLKKIEKLNWIIINSISLEYDNFILCHSLVAKTIHTVLPIKDENLLTLYEDLKKLESILWIYDDMKEKKDRESAYALEYYDFFIHKLSIRSLKKNKDMMKRMYAEVDRIIPSADKIESYPLLQLIIGNISYHCGEYYYYVNENSLAKEMFEKAIKYISMSTLYNDSNELYYAMERLIWIFENEGNEKMVKRLITQKAELILYPPQQISIFMDSMRKQLEYFKGKWGNNSSRSCDNAEVIKYSDIFLHSVPTKK